MLQSKEIHHVIGGIVVCTPTPAPEPCSGITLAPDDDREPDLILAIPDFLEPRVVAGSPPVEAKDAASFCQKRRWMKWGSG
jgi:hypothetical protein